MISSLPLRATVGDRRSRAAGARSATAAKGLRYRDFLTVALVLDGEDLFPDNWIYIHEPGVAVGRIQNYRSWSPWMVPDPDTACVGLEYFAFKGDDLWNDGDDELVALATRELEQLGLAPPSRCAAATSCASRSPTRCTTRTTPSASPRSASGSTRWRASPRSAATGCTATTTPTTRCSPAMRAVDNLLHGTDHDIWAVNVESAYHEEETDADAENPYRTVPEPPSMREPLAGEAA